MTFDELIDWVEAAMDRLPGDRASRQRVKHVRRMYKVLAESCSEWDYWKDWHALSKKVAALVGEATPQSPKRSPGHQPRLGPPERPRKEGQARKSPWMDAAKPERRLAKPRKRETIEVNPELQMAFDAVTKGRQIVFVTGGAGTGKSTFIRELRARFPEKQSVVLAPTGVAALNAGGQTIHSFCKLPPRLVTPQDIRKAKDPSLVEKLDMVIIDEISMVRADVLDGIDAFLRVNRESALPFGGVQMVLVGDLFQLPPVVTPKDGPELRERYPSPHFFSAHCLKGLKFFPVELQIVYRQRDTTFAQLLAKLRDGVGAADAVAQLNSHCAGRELKGQHLILVPTREAAAMENDARLTALPGTPRTYEAGCEGSFESAGPDRLPAPKQLALKPGAQVMFVRNDSEKRWVNGTIGIVKNLSDGSIHVRLEDGEVHEVEIIEWEDVHYALDEKTNAIVEEVAGVYRQFPLMPAWAVTIHKAQGLTLERVMVDLARGAFADGQVYVALSRCQSMEGLSLRRSVRVSEVRCSEAARQFYDKIRVRARVATG
ncbi:MAG: ATP-dependent helicase [Thermoanaerobaculia bacterium]|nr:ATP-dependent helicase [Thermoanaerobaculia bacterium]